MPISMLGVGFGVWGRWVKASRGKEERENWGKEERENRGGLFFSILRNGGFDVH